MILEHEYSYLPRAETREGRFVQDEAEILLELAGGDKDRVPDLILEDNGFVREVLRDAFEIGYSSSEMLTFMPTVMEVHKEGLSLQRIRAELKDIKEKNLPITTIISDLEKQILSDAKSGIKH